MRWALQQDTAGFFVLTNTRSLSAPDAAERNREVVRALAEAARLEGDAAYAIASRSDSTLRGYFPLETDVLAEELARHGPAGRRRRRLPRLHRTRPDHHRLRALDAHRRRDDPGRRAASSPATAASATTTPTCATGWRRRRRAAFRPRRSRRSPSADIRTAAPTACRRSSAGLSGADPWSSTPWPTPTSRSWRWPWCAPRRPAPASSTGADRRSSGPAAGSRRRPPSTPPGCAEILASATLLRERPGDDARPRRRTASSSWGRT